jgi:hypothetical protein
MRSEAAKARDRKAYELHGAHAYLNFPEDYRRHPNYRSRKKRKKAKKGKERNLLTVSPFLHLLSFLSALFSRPFSASRSFPGD